MWSADGYIYYHSLARDSDALWRVSPVGGNPEMLIEGATTSTISPDGKTVFYLLDEVGSGFSQALWWATLPDVTPRQYERGLIDKARRMSSGRLRYSPDGSRILAWFGPDGSGDSGFWLLPTSDGDPRRVLPGLSGRDFVPSNLSWLPDNRHVVMTRSDGPTPGSHLWLAEPETGEMTPLTASPGNEGSPSVSPDGRTIAFTFEATDFDLFEIPLDGSPPRSFHSTTRNEFDPAASPVDSKFAYVTDRTGTPQIWLQNREGYLQQPLVTERDFDGAASLAVGSLAFSPDGTRLVFQRASSVAEGTLRGRLLWITSVSGGKPAPISGATIETGTYQDAPTWSPNGEWIAYLSGNAPGDITLEKAQVGSRAAPATLLKGIPAFVARPQWSPDGRWILCETQEGLTIVAADGTGSRQISDPGWFTYAWDRDGRRIYGLRATDDQHHFMLVSIDTRDGAHTVVNANLGSVPQAVQPIRGFSRLRDGGFLTSIAKVKSDIYLIEGFELARPWWRPAFAKATAGQAGQAR
jgi:TolB protein